MTRGDSDVRRQILGNLEEEAIKAGRERDLEEGREVPRDIFRKSRRGKSAKAAGLKRRAILMLSEGSSVTAIAEALGVSKNTVRRYLNK